MNSSVKRFLAGLSPKTRDIPVRGLEVIREQVAQAQGLVLDVGCGDRHIGKGVIRIDIDRFAGLHAIADACRLPFKDATFSLTVCSQVLEHIPGWHLARNEILRVTQAGGRILLDVPFMYPYHASPEHLGHDYTRWTPRGLRYMFKGCEVLQEGLVVGHGSMIAVLLREFLARCFLTTTHSGLYHLMSVYLSWLLYPLSWLDGWLDRKPRAHVIGGAYFILVQKPLSV